MQHHDMIIDLSHAEGNSAYLEVQSHNLQNTFELKLFSDTMHVAYNDP